MTARLQVATSSKLPVLLRVDKDAGHGIGSDRQQAAELMADEFTLLGWQLGMTGFALH
jgi:prolyl oligopeptidase